MLSVDSLFDKNKPAVAKSPTPSAKLPADEKSDTRYRLHRRFDRLARLYGGNSVETLMRMKVVVFGVGGVGSFAAEALARSAIGYIQLVDFDEVCVTNVNRQLQAMKGATGKSKAALLAERLRLINPQAKISFEHCFYSEKNSAALLKEPWGGGDYDVVFDCIDNLTAKAHLLAECKRRGIVVISSMGAAGKRDPGAIVVADLANTEACPMAREMRKHLRKDHGFAAAGKGEFGIRAVYSKEPRTWPRELSYDGGEGFKCVCPHKSAEHGCDSRSLIDGTAVFVTGSFGLRMVSELFSMLVKVDGDVSPDRFGHRPD